MPTPILEVIDPTFLLAVGIFLIAFEALFVSFVVFWFGAAFLIVGVASYFIAFSDGIYQIAAIAIISIILLMALRSKAMELFMKPKKEHNDDFLNEKGVGVIKDGKVYYKATYWDYDSNEQFLEGEKVNVISTHNMTAVIEKR